MSESLFEAIRDNILQQQFDDSSSYLDIQGTCERHGSIWPLYKCKIWGSSE